MTVVKRKTKPRSARQARKHGGKSASDPRGEWQLQTAKARFSEVFRRARADGPQRVTRLGKEAVVIVGAEEFSRLSRRSRQPESLVDFLAQSPLAQGRSQI